MAPSPATEAFAADGGRVGVVISHGFTGTPESVRAWADAFADAGYTVRSPLLPGHGLTWRETNKSTWSQWYEAVERAYAEVAARCDTVFAAGLSMGGTLVTRLAEQKGDAISGLILVNPAFGTRRIDAKFAPYVAWLIRSQKSIGGDIKKPGVVEPANDRTPVIAFASLTRLWKVTVADLDKVTAPIRLFRSVEDHVVDSLSAQLLKAGATATTVEETLLEDSYHVATMDNDAPIIFEGSLEFVRSLTTDVAGEPAS